jgi:hypothetical protein
VVKVGPEDAEPEPVEEPLPELQADMKRAMDSRKVDGNNVRMNLLGRVWWAGMGRLLWCVG